MTVLAFPALPPREPAAPEPPDGALKVGAAALVAAGDIVRAGLTEAERVAALGRTIHLLARDMEVRPEVLGVAVLLAVTGEVAP